MTVLSPHLQTSCGQHYFSTAQAWAMPAQYMMPHTRHRHRQSGVEGQQWDFCRPWLHRQQATNLRAAPSFTDLQDNVISPSPGRRFSCSP